MSFASAALVEPISVSLAGLQRSSLVFGTPTLICGAGPIGLVALALAKAAGAYPIVVTDIADHRLEWAKKMGADEIVQVEMKWSGEEVASAVREKFEGLEAGLRPKVALECTGAQSSFYGATFGEFVKLSHKLSASQLIPGNGSALEDGSTLMQIGNGKNEQMVPFQALSMREVSLRLRFPICPGVSCWAECSQIANCFWNRSTCVSSSGIATPGLLSFVCSTPRNWAI